MILFKLNEYLERKKHGRTAVRHQSYFKRQKEKQVNDVQLFPFYMVMYSGFDLAAKHVNVSFLVFPNPRLHSDSAIVSIHDCVNFIQPIVTFIFEYYYPNASSVHLYIYKTM